MRSIRNREGFTLIELMIVVVIIGILAAIAIPRFTAVSAASKQAEAAPVLKQMCTLAESDRLRTGDWPADAAAINGWTDPGAKYFDFTFAGGIATAAHPGTGPNSEGAQPGVGTQTLDCEDGDLSDPAV